MSRVALWVYGMAIDAVTACTHALDQSGPRGMLLALTWVFALYILADSFIAAAVIRKRVWWEDNPPPPR